MVGLRNQFQPEFFSCKRDHYSKKSPMESPVVYIPIDRRLAIAEGRELPERTRGAAMFADISGFTPLTEMLARTLGPKRGAEELTVYLNRVYDELITELHRFGGSVIGFSGDAITCWFDGQSLESSTQSEVLPTMRATAAALAMQEAMSQFTELQVSGGEQVSLMMKASVATGPVRRFIVGDPHYTLLDVMAGQTLESLANGEHQADKGDVILDNTAANILGERLQIAEWRTDEHTGERFAVVTGLNERSSEIEQPWPEAEPETFANEQLQNWLLPSVYRLLHAARENFWRSCDPHPHCSCALVGLTMTRMRTRLKSWMHLSARYKGFCRVLTAVSCSLRWAIRAAICTPRSVLPLPMKMMWIEPHQPPWTCKRCLPSSIFSNRYRSDSHTDACVLARMAVHPGAPMECWAMRSTCLPG